MKVFQIWSYIIRTSAFGSGFVKTDAAFHLAFLIAFAPRRRILPASPSSSPSTVFSVGGER